LAIYPIPLSGESFKNDDGSSRQNELKRCRAGERVILERQPNNPHDSNAIFVRSSRGVGIGFIGKDYNSWIAERMDKQTGVSAQIKSLSPSGPRKLIGCVLTLATFGEDLHVPAAGGILSKLAGLFRTSS
jgi:hypothetical protein